MATTQKQVKTRIQQKHDTAENWGKATSFIPLKGEIVVYDDLGRIKVGDGTKTVSNLKFVDEHSHPYLPLTGGTLTGDLNFSSTDYDMTVSADGVDVAYTDGRGRTQLLPNSITCMNSTGETTILNADGLNFGQTQSIITGISDSKGTSSLIAVSQKCLSDNYLPLSGGTLTGALKATKFTGDGSGLTSIPAGQLAGTISSDRLPDLSSKYLPLTGGEVSGSLGVRGEDGVSADRFIGGAFMGTGCSLHPATSSEIVIDIEPHGEGENTYLAISTNSFTHYSDMENSVVDWTFTGISDSKGTSSTIAASLKCLSDNYVAKTDISNKIGADTTKVPSLKCLTDNYVAKNGEAGDLSCDSLTTTGALDVNGDAFFYGSIGGDGGFSFEASTGGSAIWNEGQNIRIGNTTTSYLDYAPDGTLTNTKGTNTLKINLNSIECNSANGSWSLTGISDAKGASSTLAMSQKGVADNYLPLSGGTVSGNLIVGTSTAKKDTTINGNLFVNGCKITGTSSGVGTSATEMPTLKCLHDNYLALSGGTLTGQLTLSSNGIKFNTNAIKDITYSTTDLTAGTSTLATNSIYIVYE